MRTTQPESMNYDRPMRIALIVGLVAAVISVAGIFVSGPGLFFQAYLYSFLFWLGISLGLLAFQMLHYLVSSRWGLTMRRVAEAASGSIWVMAVLFIPLIFGLRFLYPWARPAEVAASPAMQHQAFYNNVPFFIIRAVIYFAIWILLATIANRRSARLIKAPGENKIMRGGLQTLGAVSLILYLPTMTFASIDWLMSLQPSWSSTAFGLVIVLAQVMTGLAFAVLILDLFPGLGIGQTWNYETTPIPYRDLGALSITMVMAWAYVAYFQMLIIWAGNIPKEVVWYTARLNGGWNIVAIAIAIFQFALPFVILLTIRVRHNMRFLAWVSGLLLITNLVNLFWHVKPAFYPGVFSLSWLDIVVPFAIGGLWFAAFFTALKVRPVLTAEEELVLNREKNEEQALP